ncbi:hypothetical protein NMG60_11012019 [Bertholletia excelsa]
MGAGRKSKTIALKEKSPPSWTVNCSRPARNLRKSDIGAVIFGCKNNTIGECYSKQIFGLPAAHFAYVKNISPGLPLFLFNYSDRRLHGIFEATSSGQMNINPYGWTADDSDCTPYPAQVKVQIRIQCQPLLEDQFRPVIASNYYKKRHFWFELDRAQTKELISLFKPLPTVASVPLSQNALPSSDARQNLSDGEIAASQEGSAYSDQFNGQWGLWEDPGSQRESQVLGCSADAMPAGQCEEESAQPVMKCAGSYSSVPNSTSTSLPVKKWTALFKTSTTSDTLTEYSSDISSAGAHLPEKKWSALCETPMASDTLKNDDFKRQVSEFNIPYSHQQNIEWGSSFVSPCMETELQHFEAHKGQSPVEDWEEYVSPKSDFDPSILAEEAESFQQTTSSEALTKVDTRQEGDFVKVATSDGNIPCSEKLGMAWCSQHSAPQLVGEGELSEASTDGQVTEVHAEELLHPKTNSETSCSAAKHSDDDHGNETVNLLVMAEVHSTDGCCSEVMAAAEMQSSRIQSILPKFESRLQIKRLENRCHALELRRVSSNGDVPGAVIETYDEPHLEIDDSVLIVGGFDGFSWLSALDSYSLSRDTMKSLKPMTFARSYASAATLNDELYIFGGVDGNIWHDTVESYYPGSDQWVSRPSLNRKKGSLAGASFHGKIFAVGGGNGVECYSDVEMLDIHIGRWIPSQSMLSKRFAPAAAEINGTLFVVGGYDGRNYLNTIERFDPREQLWTSLGNMSTRRGCHALTVLNDKLYALGGYDGAKMVSTVEIFDPRLNSWMMGEAMNDSRGYAGAVVNGDKIYVIGGINNDDKILDEIECFKEGGNWEVADLRAVGKRCFFSAVVL